MKLKLLLGFLILSQMLFAQSFTEVMNIPFEGVASGSVAFSDVDGDGDYDVLIMGGNDSDERIAKLYTNDEGSYTEVMDTPFDGTELGSMVFLDVDGDGDDDVLITGQNALSDPIAKLYTNDGGIFTEVMGTNFGIVLAGSIAFSDVDGDGDNDVLTTGDSGGQPIAKLYTNDGAIFTEVMGTPFDGVVLSSVAFSDVDGDGDNDVLITGENGSDEPIAKLYTNAGGIFTEVIDTPFEGVWFSSIAFSDVDSDGDDDVLITGQNALSDPIAKLYTNDGGIFTEVLGTPFDGVWYGSIAFSDVDSDGDQDVLITGQIDSGVRIAKLYTNEGGSFTEVLGTPFDGVWSSSIAFSDVDGDGDNDVLITGEFGFLLPIAKLYINNGAPNSNDDSMLKADLFFVPYPNPTNSALLNLRFDSPESGFSSINIYDLQGRLCLQQREFVAIGEQIISVDIASLSPGTYFIEIDNGNENGVAKFVVQ